MKHSSLRLLSVMLTVIAPHILFQTAAFGEENTVISIERPVERPDQIVPAPLIVGDIKAIPAFSVSEYSLISVHSSAWKVGRINCRKNMVITYVNPTTGDEEKAYPLSNPAIQISDREKGAEFVACLTVLDHFGARGNPFQNLPIAPYPLKISFAKNSRGDVYVSRIEPYDPDASQPDMVRH